MTDLAPSATDAAMIQLESAPADRNPAAVYLSRLGRGSRRTMEQALHTIAQLIAGDQYDAFTLPWAALEYQHTQAVRTAWVCWYWSTAQGRVKASYCSPVISVAIVCRACSIVRRLPRPSRAR